MFDFFKRKNSGADDGSKGSAPKGQPAAPDKTTQEVLRSFMDTLLPDAVDTLLFKASMAGADDADFSGFERYAARLLTEADGGRLRQVAVKSPLDLRWLNSTGMFWTNFNNQEVGEEGRRLVLRTESALSRLALVAQKMEAQTGSRSVSTFTEADLYAFDDEALRSIADAATDFFNRSQDSNDLLSLNGVSGERGGNWDLSTRMAKAAESIVLPYRLEYRFATDSATGAIAVKISLPRSEDFPHSRYDAAAGKWVDCSAELGAQAAAYAVRLVTLVAACAFGCSIGINRVVVTGFDGSLEGAPLISMEFARMPFTLTALEAVRDGRMKGEPGAADPAYLLSLVHPTAQAISLSAAGDLEAIEPLPATLSVPNTPLVDDQRELPEELQGTFQATRACELDVISPQDQDLLARYRAIMDERDDSLLLAAAQLEEIVAQTKEKDEAALAAASAAYDKGKVSLLYCENVFCRFLTSLVDPDPTRRYCRMADVGFGSRSALVDINRDMGDNDSAEALCKEMLQLAPTSTAPYMDLINTYANKEDYAAVIEVCQKALEFAMVKSDISLLFYRLGYAFWQTKQYLPALAAYERVHPDSPFAGAMENERAGVIADMGGNGPDGNFDGAAVLRMAGIPLPPTDTAEHLVALAAIQLCDKGFLAAAAPAATALGMFHRNDILDATAASFKAWVAQ